jgi:hypothetical protein
MNLSGGSLKMETKYAPTSSQGIIVKSTTKTAGGPNSFVAQERRSFCVHGEETLCLFGESSKMIRDKKELIAPSSATNRPIKVVSLSDRQTPLLMQSGLIKGITPMSMRQKSGQLTLGTATNSLDGNVAVSPR